MGQGCVGLCGARVGWHGTGVCGAVWREGRVAWDRGVWGCVGEGRVAWDRGVWGCVVGG